MRSMSAHDAKARFGQLLDAARNELAARVEEVRCVRELCQRTLRVLGELKGLVGNPSAFNRKIVRVDELRAAIQKRDRVFQMVTSVSQQAELRRFAADHKLSGAKSGSRKRAMLQLKRDREFVAGVIEGADELEVILKGAMERMERVLSGESA